MKKSCLHREYARCIDMCEGTAVNPWRCVRYYNSSCNNTLNFSGDANNYIFALFIIENRPVFVGDVLFLLEDGTQIKVTAADQFIINKHLKLSWSQPVKKTFTPDEQEKEKIDKIEPLFSAEQALKMIKYILDHKK